jgi:hypothetical protein
MRVLAFGTAGKTFVMALLCFVLRYRRPDPDVCLYESDRNKTPRFISPLGRQLVDLDDRVSLIDCPLERIASRLDDDEFAHFRFASREALGSSHSSGLENERTVGEVATLWIRGEMTSRIASLGESPDATTKPRLVMMDHAAGSTGSTLGVNAIEAIQKIKEKSGGNIDFSVDTITTLQPGRDFDDQNKRLFRNEAAKMIEMGALQVGGACFPSAGRSGWGVPESFTQTLRHCVLHDPGDRGLTPTRFSSTMGLGAFHIFLNPELSPYFHRDADDQHSKSYDGDGVPAVWSYGASLGFVPDAKMSIFVALG